MSKGSLRLVTLKGKQHLVVLLLSLRFATRSMQHTNKVGILPGEQMKFTKDKERNNHRKLYRERQYLILRLGESKRGVREPLTVSKEEGYAARGEICANRST